MSWKDDWEFFLTVFIVNIVFLWIVTIIINKFFPGFFEELYNTFIG